MKKSILKSLLIAAIFIVPRNLPADNTNNSSGQSVRLRESIKNNLPCRRTPSRLAIDCELIGGQLWLCPNFDDAFTK